jgi:hypothetical protein
MILHKNLTIAVISQTEIRKSEPELEAIPLNAEIVFWSSI